MKQIFVCHLNIRSLVQQSDCGIRFNHLYNYACRDNSYDLAAINWNSSFSGCRWWRNKFGRLWPFQIRQKPPWRRRSYILPLWIGTENNFKVEHPEHWNALDRNLRPKFKKIIFGVCYRPPNQNTDERSFFLDGLHSVFDEVLDIIKLPFILLGDFNDRCTSWGKDHKNSELKFDLVNLLKNFNFSQLINEPTRNDSILDLIITNCPGYIYKFGVDDPIKDLDHCPIFGHMKFVYKKNHAIVERYHFTTNPIWTN